MNADTPQISNASYSSNVTTCWGGDLGTAVAQPWKEQMENRYARRIHNVTEALGSLLPEQHQLKLKPMPENTRRIVQVFIADTNENVPLDKSVLYSGDQKLTDATDAELFFEIPIKELLDTHNASRVKWLDKEASKRSGKDVFLDPVKIRDLKMVVVDIAKFA